ERGPSQNELQERKEIVGRKETLEAVTFGAVCIRHDQGGRPLGFEALEILRAFLDVDLNGYKVLTNEPAHLLLRVNLGIQPSASRSHGRGAEIKQNHLVL